MSKYKPKMYAEALINSILYAKADTKNITRNFLKFLDQNGDIKKAPQIVALAESLLLKKTGNKKIILETARKTDPKRFAGAFVKKGDILEEKINPGIVAGIKVIIDNEEQLDFSLLKKLENLF